MDAAIDLLMALDARDDDGEYIGRGGAVSDAAALPQADRLREVLGIQYTREDQVECPTCLAPPGVCCRTESGETARESHRARWAATGEEYRALIDRVRSGAKETT